MGKRKNVNIVEMLKNRECGLTKEVREEGYKMLKSLVCSPTREFLREETITSIDGVICYENRKIFVNRRTTVLSVDSIRHLSHGPSTSNGGLATLYNITCLRPREKIEDAILFEQPMEDHNAKRRLYALTSLNRLLIINSENGQLENAFLLHPEVKFKEVGWNAACQSFYIRGRQKKSPGNHGQSPLSLCSVPVFALFSVWPFQFLGQFCVEPTVFGTAINCTISGNGLIVTSPKPRKSRIYSLERILNSCTEFIHNISDTVEETNPLPFNVVIKSEPDILYEIGNSTGTLEIGGFPWHCLYRTGPKKDYRLVPLGDASTSVSFESPMLRPRPDNEQDTFFHPDESGTLMHVGQDHVLAWKLERCDPKETTKCKHFLSEMWKSKLKEDTRIEQVRFSRSGRRVINNYAFQDMETTIDSVQYEDDLRVLVVAKHQSAGLTGESNSDSETILDDDYVEGSKKTQTKDSHIRSSLREGYDGTAEVVLLENEGGKILKTIPLEEKWKMLAEHRVELDLDVLIHIVKRGPKSVLYLYRLNEYHVEDFC